MNFLEDSEAKAIVKRDLEKWKGTWTDFLDFLKHLKSSAKGVSSIEKRETFLRKSLKRIKPDIYSKEVKVKFSHSIVFEGHAESDNHAVQSKSERQKIAKNEEKLARHLHKLSTKTTHAFVVKNNSKNPKNELIILIFKTRGSNKEELLSSHSVGVIKKHCLERVVQRLALKNIYQAIDEILSALVWMEGSGSELAGRAPGSYGERGFKRHIPTPNGALLLHTDSFEGEFNKPSQICSLITWIHKKQFKKNQEVTKRDFIFAQMINHYLSDPNLDKELEYFKNHVSSFHAANKSINVIVNIHGERYPATDFISALENRQYLDHMMDFEK